MIIIIKMQATKAVFWAVVVLMIMIIMTTKMIIKITIQTLMETHLVNAVYLIHLS